MSTDDTNAALRGSESNDLLGLGPERAEPTLPRKLLDVAASARAWLVEWRFNGVQWLYLWPQAPGGFSFTSDASRALRFARREDAEAALQWALKTDAARRPIGSLSQYGLGLGALLATEHEWPNAKLTGDQRP